MKWKKTVGVAIVMAMVGLYGTAKAGPVLSGGGGDEGDGGGGRNYGRSVSLGSGYDNDSAERGSPRAWANADGPLLTTQMSSWFSFTPSSNPEPGNAGWLNVTINAQGDFIPSDGTVTPGMLNLAENPLSTGGSFRINEVTVEQGDKFIIYRFDPELQVSWSGTGSFYIDPEGPKHRGFLNAGVWLDGGAFNDARADFEANDWHGEGPRPDWLADWSANFNFSGLATPTSVTVIPEPASAALLAIGGSALFWRRRKKNRERNLIA